MKKKVGMLGGGAWGTAMANLLAGNGHEVVLWCYEKDVVDCIAQKQINDRYLPSIPLSPLIQPTHDLEQVFNNSEIIFIAIPVAFIRTVIASAQKFVDKQHRFIILSKGLEQKTLKLSSQIIEDLVENNNKIACVAGPSFAREIGLCAVTGLIAASQDDQFLQEIQQLINNSYCSIYSSHDLIGVQVGGAFKNVVSIGLGILDGAQCAGNTKALVFTQGLAEMGLIAKALGGKQESLYGLSGVGDLYLTSLGSLSRNGYLGLCLGQGNSLDTIIKELGNAPEGINTAASVNDLVQRYKLELPVLTGIHHMIHGEMILDDFLNTIIKSR